METHSSSHADEPPTKRNRTSSRDSPQIGVESMSVSLRGKGNEVFKTVKEGLAPSIREDRLQRALQYYQQAQNCASTDFEKSAAAKNIAMTHWKLAQACIAMGTLPVTITHHFVSAQKSFELAQIVGQCQSTEWQSDVSDRSLVCWTAVAEQVKDWQYKPRIQALEKAIVHVRDGPAKAREYLAIASHYFHWSLDALEKREYRECLQRLGECYRPVEEAKRLAAGEEGILAEAELLHQDIAMHTNMARSIQERSKGEELLCQLTQEEESLNMDGVWQVVDLFRHAAILTREHSVELEAQAFSALGRVYHQVLKLKSYARQYLVRSLQLANCMLPRNFTGVEWYEYAQRTLQEYQLTDIREEEAARHKERAAVMEDLKDELFDLKKAFDHKGKLEFLEFVYKTFPPTNAKHKLVVPQLPEVSDIKKLYQKAVTHYHPDRVHEEQHGKKCKVLMEEITKFLTRHYENYK